MASAVPPEINLTTATSVQLEGETFILICNVVSNPLIRQSDLKLFFRNQEVLFTKVSNTLPEVVTTAAKWSVDTPNISSSQGQYTCSALYRDHHGNQTVVNSTRDVTIYSTFSAPPPPYLIFVVTNVWSGILSHTPLRH